MDFSRPAYNDRFYQLEIPRRASVQEANIAHKIISFFVLLILSPLWILLSIISEVLIIPLYMTINVVKRAQGNNFFGLVCLISPLLFLTFVVFCSLLTVVSFIMKIYGGILAKDVSKAIQELVFPENHPVYENYFKTKVQKVEQEKPKQFVSTAETEASYQPPHSSFESDDILFSKAKHENF